MSEALAEALAHHRAGRLEAAQRIYRRILSRQPGHADALHLLGVLCFQSDRHEAAAGYIRRAIELNPAAAFYHLNLGNALQALGRLEEAAACYREALRLDPLFAEAHNNLGNVLLRLSRIEEAEACLEESVRLKPEALAWSNLAALRLRRERFEAAEAACREALRLGPDHAEALHNLSVALLEQGRAEEAIASCREALRLRPGHAEAHNVLGAALEHLGRLEEALASYRRALEHKPDYVEASNNCGNALAALGRHAEAAAYFERALAIKPDDAAALNNVGNTLQFRGRIAEAIACYRRAVELEPGFHLAHSNLVFCLNYDPECDPAALFREHTAWAERHARGLPIADHANEPAPGRRLRLGYVSPDFRGHPVAFFLEPVLARHSRREFEITCYSNVGRPDAFTERFRALGDRWRDIRGMRDERVAELIREDGIDILIDLAGYTTGGRLLVFARKPAPVQAAWLGYPNTTGLATVDYRITDAWADPAGQAEALHTEKLVRLPRGFLCYQPPADAPPVSELPLLRAGAVTFGSFNNLAKVTPAAIAAWAAILERLPGARLIVKSKGLADAETQRGIHGLFRNHGVRQERVELLAAVPAHSGHLELYGRVDIALDTFPYNGTTTTCEALWMGVPVVTLEGARHAARVGVSLLSTLGLTELIAGTPERYVELAVALARDPDRLGELRAGLRERMARSPLTDARGFTRALEEAYRRMWHAWCARALVARSAALNERRRFEEAANACREALALEPDCAEAHNNLGSALAQLGRVDQAIASFREALRLRPDYPPAHNNLAAALLKRGQLEEAAACCREALRSGASDPAPYNNLATAFRKTGQIGRAMECLEAALRINPNCAETYANLGALLTDGGRVEEAIPCCREAARLNPDSPVNHSNLLLSLNYDAGADPAEVFREHRLWSERYEAPLAAAIPRHANRPDPDRRLRIGYVSPDFCTHPVSQYLPAFLEAHDRTQFEVTCYANVARADAVTESLKALGHRWRDIFGLTDAEAAELARQDGIDILVDLAGHTRNNRLLLFARKPAPVQVTWIGYPNTTGLTAINYRITDAWADPPGQTEHLHSEELVRLPLGFTCYRPRADVPEVGPLPALARRAVTFASFNKAAKITPPVLDTWSEILRQTPGAKLILKSPCFTDEETRRRFHAGFARRGVAEARVRLLAPTRSIAEHLALYSQADLALDPFPYNGTTTTCEALWLGVPVIVLAGRTHAGRTGVSLLSNIGLTEFIAGSREDYVARAVRFARELEALARVRAGLRQRMAGAPLTRGPAFTRTLEEAYRRMWQRWCEKHA